MISQISAPSRKSPSLSRAGIQSVAWRMASRMGSVIATPTEKQVSTPYWRRARMWVRNPWVQPAESLRMRIGVP